MVTISPETKVKNNKKRCKCSLGPFKGYFYGVLAAAFYCVGNVIVKLVNGLSPTDHLITFYGLQFIVMLGYALIVKESILGPTGTRKLLLLRGLLQPVAVCLLYYALIMIPVSDVVAINHCSLIFTAILSRIFLKELLGFPHIFAIILTFFGVALISKPTFLFGTIKYVNVNSTFNQTLNMTEINENVKPNNLNTALGVSLALLAAVCWGVVRLLTKKTTNAKIHWVITNLFTSYIGFPVGLIVSIVLYSTGFSSLDLFSKGASAISYQIGLSLLSGVFKIFGAVFYVLAFSHEDATKVSIASTTDLVIAFFLQAVVLGEQIGLLSIIGSILVLLGSIVVLVYKLFENKYMKNKESKKSHKPENKCEKIMLFKF